MKKLYIIRHAKSSWDNPEMDDLDRPLNKRGKRDAPQMGKRLKEKEVELLKTVPPKLYPYYTQEVGEYFKRIKIQEIN